MWANDNIYIHTMKKLFHENCGVAVTFEKLIYFDQNTLEKGILWKLYYCSDPLYLCKI